jgi:transposase
MSRTTLISDAGWARIEPLLPSSDGQRGRPFRDHRQVIEGIAFRLRTGLAWRDLPAEFGPWQTVWKRHRRFSLDGTWDKILRQLQAEADAAGLIDWRTSVDSTIARVHQHGATAARSVSSPSSHTGGSVE